MPELPEVPGLKPGKNTLPDPAHEVNPPIPETPAAPPDVKVSDWRLTPTLTEKRLISTPIVGRSTKPAPLAKPHRMTGRTSLLSSMPRTDWLSCQENCISLQPTRVSSVLFLHQRRQRRTQARSHLRDTGRYRNNIPGMSADATADPLFSTTPASTDGWYPMS